MKPIQSQFQAAARLVNEWRDTLYYSALIVAAGSAAAQGQLTIPLMNVVLKAALFREVLRIFEWGVYQENRRVGVNAPRVDSVKNQCAAFLGMQPFSIPVSIPPLSHTISQEPIFLSVIGVQCALFLLNRRGAGLRDLPRIYFDEKTGMWDWPRKRGDGGGTTQTQKLIDGFKKMGRKLAGALPAPTPVPGMTRALPQAAAQSPRLSKS